MVIGRRGWSARACSGPQVCPDVGTDAPAREDGRDTPKGKRGIMKGERGPLMLAAIDSVARRRKPFTPLLLAPLSPSSSHTQTLD